MKKSKIATTIVEAMVVTIIVVLGLTGVYTIYSSSIKLSTQTENKIQAIQIAREGIEAVTNIRDTNGLLFGSNIDNCWKVLDYNNNCLLGTTGFNNIVDNGDYRVYRDINNRWILESALASIGNSFTNINYKNFYKIYLDSNGLYTHSTGNDTKILYTRQIKTRYLNPNTGLVQATATDGLLITSIVRWSDSSSSELNEVKLETILTNYK
ncbi:MAG: hypothetical protein PHI37_02595 [Candidatus Gracilibacteria bacterium]|nr:hypothetical protein [Candidatus Gracilibacteria bacterium]